VAKNAFKNTGGGTNDVITTSPLDGVTPVAAPSFDTVARLNDTSLLLEFSGPALTDAAAAKFTVQRYGDAKNYPVTAVSCSTESVTLTLADLSDAASRGLVVTAAPGAVFDAAHSTIAPTRRVLQPWVTNGLPALKSARLIDTTHIALTFTSPVTSVANSSTAFRVTNTAFVGYQVSVVDISGGDVILGVSDVSPSSTEGITVTLAAGAVTSATGTSVADTVGLKIPEWTPPTLVVSDNAAKPRVSVYKDRQVLLSFSEEIDSVGIDSGKFIFASGTAVLAARRYIDPFKVVLITDTSVNEGDTLTVQAGAVTDVNGTPCAAQAAAAIVTGTQWD
jgi:hypothetical protein